MPHAGYNLPRDVSAILARCESSVRHLLTWYKSGNPGQALGALQRAGSVALSNHYEELTPDERAEIGRMLADLSVVRATSSDTEDGKADER